MPAYLFPQDKDGPQLGNGELYREICTFIMSGIMTGAFAEDTQIPSTNSIARHFSMNPATALKGINLLVEQGVLYKRRGVGMFVSAGARKKLLEQRRMKFGEEYVVPLVREARKLGITRAEIIDMMDREGL